MPPTTHAVREGFAIDRASNTIRFLRDFAAPISIEPVPLRIVVASYCKPRLE